MGAFEELSEVSKTLQNSYVSDWKEKGKKVVGYICTYMPEEILFAADILPFRITGQGADDTSHADAYLSRVNCSFTRCCLELAFRGEYDFLDGAILIDGCDHLNRYYDNWAAHKSAPPLMHIFPVPHLINSKGREWFKEEAIQVKNAIEDRFRIKVDSEKLAEARTIYNESRKLLKQLYDLRTGDKPAFTGAEVHTILSASARMPKVDFNRLLSSVLSETETRAKAKNGRIRLLVAGSMMDEPEFIENVEDMGAVVVTDALCFGTRSFWDLTDENGDPFETIIDRYYKHAPCPRMAGQYPARLEFIKKQAEQARIDGVILEHIKFCDVHGADNALLKNDLEKAGIPVLELERQYGPLADAGRIRTRVQAFYERIRK